MESSTGQLAAALSRPSRMALRAPKAFLALVLVAVAAAALLGASGLDRLSPFSADAPDSESVQARELLGAASGVDPDFGLIALVRTPAGVEDPAARARVAAVERVLADEPLVAEVRSWYESDDPALVAADRRATYVVGGLRPSANRTRRATSSAGWRPSRACCWAGARPSMPTATTPRARTRCAPSCWPSRCCWR